MANDNSIATGIPARHIGPETGSSGNATMTDKGGTSEGVNEAADSRPAPAAGFEPPLVSSDAPDEERSFISTESGFTDIDADDDFDSDDETPAQRIADGDDRIRHDRKD